MTVRLTTRNAPTKRSLAWLRAQGCIVDVAERRQGPISVDWLGAFDIVGVTPSGHLIVVQTTSRSNFASRLAKVRQCPELAELLARGCVIEVHGWDAGKEEPKIEVVDSCAGVD